MKDKLIKILGGWTLSEVNSLRDKIDERESFLSDELVFYKETIEKKDAEIIRLTNLMLSKSGFLIEEGKEIEKTQHKPINKRKTWPQMQKELEISDAKKQADETERRWLEKQAAQVSN